MVIPYRSVTLGQVRGRILLAAGLLIAAAIVFIAAALAGLELSSGDRILPGVMESLRRLGHKVTVVGPFMMDTGTTLVGVDPHHGTLFGAADVRRQRFVVGW